MKKGEKPFTEKTWFTEEDAASSKKFYTRCLMEMRHVPDQESV